MSLSTTSVLRDSVELIKRTVCKGATDLELELFIRQCEKTGLDPFSRQIYAIKRWDPSVGTEVMQTQVSIDGLRTIAAQTDEMGGQAGPFWCGADGLWHDVWLGSGKPRAAKVTIIRRGYWGTSEFTGVALWDSYAQRKKDGSFTRMWNQMGPEMLAKCAEALALRKAFPQGLSGLYTGDEMSQADNPIRESKSDESIESRPGKQTSDGDSVRPLPPILDPPRPAESDTGASTRPDPMDAMRQRVSAELAKLSIVQRDAIAVLAEDAHVLYPDEAGFAVADANKWLTMLREVRNAGSGED